MKNYSRGLCAQHLWHAALLSGFTLPAVASPADNAAVQARQLVQAAVALDAERVIDLTHPRVYELGGDAAGARARLRAVFTSLKSDGLAHEVGVRTLERAELLAPSTPVRFAPKTMAVFVPYHAVERSHQGRFAVKAFYLGLSEDGGRHWRFIDGASLDDQSMRLFAAGWAGVPPLPARSRQPLPGTGR